MQQREREKNINKDDKCLSFYLKEQEIKKEMKRSSSKVNPFPYMQLYYTHDMSFSLHRPIHSLNIPIGR